MTWPTGRTSGPLPVAWSACCTAATLPVSADGLDIYHQREPRNLAAALRFSCDREHQAHRAARDVRAVAAVLDARLARHGDLPRTVAGLHRRMVEVDVGGWFRREGGLFVFAVGKYRGGPRAEVARNAPDYLYRLLTQGLLDDARFLAERALQANGGG